MPKSLQMSAPGPRTASSPVLVVKAATDCETGKCPARDVASRVPDGGWGWLVVGGSFIIMVSDGHRCCLQMGPLCKCYH